MNSAVIALSVPMLTPDSGDETNRLLRLILQGVDNNTLTSDDIHPAFVPSNDAIRINRLFSVSLTCSMIAAFGALLGQQWITSYKRRFAGGFEEERQERQRRLLGAQRWRLETVLDRLLPMLLQISLIVFLVGMIDYLQSLNFPVALPCAIICGLSVVFFTFTIIFSLIDPHCPFKTSFSQSAGPLLTRGIRWIYSHDRVSSHLSSLNTNWAARLSSKTEAQLEQWLVRKWPDEVLEGHSIRRILTTSADSETLHAMALNVPLMTNQQSMNIIYSDNSAISRLHQLYAIHSTQYSAERYVYSAAICHLMLNFGEENSERTNYLLQGHELRIIFDAAQGHISSEGGPLPIPPSSTMTVGFAYLLSETGDDSVVESEDDTSNRHMDFLRASLQNSTTPDISVAIMAWVMISSKRFFKSDRDRRRALKDLGFRHPSSQRHESGLGIFREASEAYKKFAHPPRFAIHRAFDLQ